MVAMTTREPTEAMRETAKAITVVWATGKSSTTLEDAIARALMEQDAAARREGFEQAREAAATEIWDGTEQPPDTWINVATGLPTWTPIQAERIWRAQRIRALTPVAASEKENEGGP